MVAFGCYLWTTSVTFYILLLFHAQALYRDTSLQYLTFIFPVSAILTSVIQTVNHMQFSWLPSSAAAAVAASARCSVALDESGWKGCWPGHCRVLCSLPDQPLLFEVDSRKCLRTRQSVHWRVAGWDPCWWSQVLRTDYRDVSSSQLLVYSSLCSP